MTVLYPNACYTEVCFHYIQSKEIQENIDYLFVCFVALRPKSIAMVMAGRSVHLTTLFPGQA